MASTSGTETTPRRRRRDEEGSSAIEMVIIFPVTLVVVLLIIQFGVWYHAADIARSAAQQGLKTAAAYGSTGADGRARADAVLRENGRSLITSPEVSTGDDAELVRVTVTGTALRVVPFLHLSIRESVTAPVESFRPPPAP